MAALTRCYATHFKPLLYIQGITAGNGYIKALQGQNTNKSKELKRYEVRNFTN